MNEQQAEGGRWGDSISEERKSVLQGCIDRWNTEESHGKRKGPFAEEPGEVLGLRLTGADVYWLAEQSGRGNFGHVPNLHLEGADLQGADLDSAHLGAAHLEDANLFEAQLQDAELIMTHLEGADLVGAHLKGAGLLAARLEGADLSGANLESAIISEAHLEGAYLWETRLEGADLTKAHLGGASLQGAFFSDATRLDDIMLGSNELGYISLADVRWRDVNLAVVDWTRIQPSFLGLGKRIDIIELGDVRDAHKPTMPGDKPKNDDDWITGYKVAVRANRQLATVLRSQGLNEDADRFAYKAQKLQRKALRLQGQLLRWFGSLLLDGIAGYGYRPLRAFGAYAFVIVLFMGLYLLNSHFVSPHLTWNEALVLSMSSFHGRGFFNPNIQLGDTYAQLAAIEAFVGLFIEVTFIATFTQRFFAR